MSRHLIAVLSAISASLAGCIGDDCPAGNCSDVSVSPSGAPAQMAPEPTVFTAPGSSFATSASGKFFAWGRNWDLPQAPDNIKDFAVNGSQVLFLKEDGLLLWYVRDGADLVLNEFQGVEQVEASKGRAAAVLATGEVIIRADDSEAPLAAAQQPPVGLAPVSRIALGPHHTLALHSDGSVSAWGSNPEGAAYDLLAVPDQARDVVAIAAGTFHSLALRRDGSLLAWGSEAVSLSRPPAAITAEVGAVDIAVARLHSSYEANYVLLEDGSLWRWSDRVAGPMYWGDWGAGSRTPYLAAEGIAAIEGTYDSNLLTVTTAGEVRAVRFCQSLACVGPGQLPAASAVTGNLAFMLDESGYVVPLVDILLSEVMLETPFQQIISTSGGGPEPSLVGLSSTGEVYGSGGYGGEGVTAFSFPPMFAASIYGDKFNFYTRDHEGIIHYPATVPDYRSESFHPANHDLPPVRLFAVGWRHIVAVTEDNTIITRSDPEANMPNPPTVSSPVRALSAGPDSSVALLEDGTVMQWGRGSENWPKPDFPVPASTVAAGYGFNLALLEDGSVVQWGPEAEPIPFDVEDVVAIGVDRGQAVALRSDGTFVAWGWQVLPPDFNELEVSLPLP